MTGMYVGMSGKIFCRLYGSAVRTSGCPQWATPRNHPRFYSGAIVHPQTNEQNIGGNCCCNTTFVSNGIYEEPNNAPTNPPTTLPPTNPPTTLPPTNPGVYSR